MSIPPSMRGLAFALYLLFVVYGSLVPLDFQPISLETALWRFAHMPYLDLGAESRADWVANILLYMPLAFLAASLAQTLSHPLARRAGQVLAVVFCLAVAVGVEFAQLYFPQRTVSRNDLIAEALGTGLGFAGWLWFGGRLERLCAQLLADGRLSVTAAMVVYLLAYLALSLFPFDFVASVGELADKLDGDSVGLFIAAAHGQNPFHLVKLGAELLALAPLGMLLAMRPHAVPPMPQAMLAGLLLGVLIEGLQVLIYSAVAQGASVLTRIAGMALGVRAGLWLGRQRLGDWLPRLGPIALAAWVPYLLLLMAANGWFTGDWLTAEAALAKLADTRFLPFYYFYYTTETVAMSSLLANSAAYLPVAGLFWLGFGGPGRRRKPHWSWVGLAAMLLAAVIEAGKLFLAAKHADPTDVLIAGVAASLGYVGLLRGWPSPPSLPSPPSPDDGRPPLLAPLLAVRMGGRQPAVAAAAYSFQGRRLWFCLPLGLSVVWAASHFPLLPATLTLLLLAYAALLWRFPDAWLVVLPALLPVLDLTPYTGRFFVDEFDLVVLTTLAVGHCRSLGQSSQSNQAQGRPRRLFSGRINLLLGLFLLCYLVSLGLGLQPLPPVDSNAFNNYHSPYNALRVGKGVLLAFLLLPLLRRSQLGNQQALRLFGYGTIAGLAAMSAFVIGERWVFTGLADFAYDYRINALFSSMHTGGGHIESYLSLCLPFLALPLLCGHRSWPCVTLVAVVFVAALYALLMSFSRGGYIGCAVGLAVLVAAVLARPGWPAAITWRACLAVAGGVGLVAVLAAPVLQGDLMRQRFAVTSNDKEVRVAHWQNALAMMDTDWDATLFGMGLGSFPRLFYLLAHGHTPPATYRLAQEGDNLFLQLHGGDALYFGQYLPIAPHAHYQLQIDLRSQHPGAALSMSICEKSLQYSFRCQQLAAIPADQGWQTRSQTVASGELASQTAAIGGGWLARPVQLALHAPVEAGVVVEVDNIRLTDADGEDLIRNGGFSRGSDHWFFSTKQHKPWHIFNLWVDLVFHTGWLGLAGFALLLLTALTRLLSILKTNRLAAVWLASFSGFLVVGMVDSPFDAPRLALLFFLLLFLALSMPRLPVSAAAEI